MNLSIVILAAGKGSRMKSSKAKVLHSISGKEMLYFIIKESLKISNDITVVIHHQKEAVQEAMIKHFGDKINFLVQDADNFPGTGGAVKGIKPKHDKVLVLNGDMPLITAEALSGFETSDADITMSIFDLEDSSGYGRVIIGKNGSGKSTLLELYYISIYLLSVSKELLDFNFTSIKEKEKELSKEEDELRKRLNSDLRRVESYSEIEVLLASVHEWLDLIEDKNLKFYPS